ncbi:MAG: hypothetical protein HZA12_03080 [Nitrospirae bacterium]|nr:hypothetical protein [Nitrospirota bacterium]
MKIKEQAIKDLDTLKPSELLIVYDLILSLKGKKPERAFPVVSAYKKVREALKGCKGSLTEDILSARTDRI